MLNNLINLDGNILLWIQDFIRNDFLSPIFIFITHLGNGGKIWIAISIFLLLFKKTRKIGMMSLLGLLGSYLINNLCIKNLVCRTRPYEVVDGLKLIIERQRDFSFPSGHTASSFASAIVLYKELPKKYGITALIFATIMGLSRLYVGVHYPSDVIVGAISGILIGLGVCRIYHKLESRNLNINKQ